MLAPAQMNRPIAVEDLARRLPLKARLIGVDLGSKTIGLAISDVERRIASPLRTLRRTAFQKDADALLTIFAEFEIAAIVLGLPLDLEGGDSRRAQINSRLCPQPWNPNPSPDHAVGRAIFDCGCAAVADRK